MACQLCKVIVCGVLLITGGSSYAVSHPLDLISRLTKPDPGHISENQRELFRGPESPSGLPVYIEEIDEYLAAAPNLDLETHTYLLARRASSLQILNKYWESLDTVEEFRGLWAGKGDGYIEFLSDVEIARAMSDSGGATEEFEPSVEDMETRFDAVLENQTVSEYDEFSLWIRLKAATEYSLAGTYDHYYLYRARDELQQLESFLEELSEDPGLMPARYHDTDWLKGVLVDIRKYRMPELEKRIAAIENEPVQQAWEALLANAMADANLDRETDAKKPDPGVGPGADQGETRVVGEIVPDWTQEETVDGEPSDLPRVNFSFENSGRTRDRSVSWTWIFAGSVITVISAYLFFLGRRRRY